ncbi:MAG: DUF4332 domain-containing protein [Microscillaceae bacterium]|nr:DUF4332 domain-containing protein [Microscillaceae bacterium]
MKKQYLKSKSACKVTFSLPKEVVQEAKNVMVLGEFNDWSYDQAIAMKPGKDGVFKADLELETGRDYEFRYLIDNERWENDWSADKYVPSPFLGIENSVVSLSEAVLEKKQSEVKTSKAVKSSKKAKKEDDLTKIEGIGTKIAGLLKEAGIDSWAKLAEAPLETLKKVLDDAGSRYKMHDPTTWAEQAQLALNGEWDKLEVLQNELKGGKR